MIERMARLQSETGTAGFDKLAVKLGEAASTAAKHFEKLDTVLGDFEIERNRLRNKGK